MEIIPLAAVIGLLGAILGAWLNSIFTTKRERWNLKRELYCRLLENLGEVKDALGHLLDLETQYNTADRGWSDKQKEIYNARAEIAEEKLRVATWIAAFMLPHEVIDALQELRKEWDTAHQADAYYEFLDSKAAAATKSYDLLIKAARRDLKF